MRLFQTPIPLMILMLILFPRQLQCALIKSVNLTTSNTVQDGAAITASYNTDGYIQNNQWRILVASNSQRGYHYEINLDKTWGFRTNIPSTISFTMYSPTPLGVPDLDLLISFSTKNNKYITYDLCLDDEAPNWIYPNCDTKSSPTQSIPTGDVKSCVEQSSCQGCSSRECKAFGGSGPDAVAPSNTNSNFCKNGHCNHWPLTISITNDPIKHQAFTTVSTYAWNGYTQGCGYGESFASNAGLQIYIALDDQDQYIAFDKFRIEYFYATAEPTPVPTNQPTPSPTDNPTPPTNNPTPSPTDNPTPSPTNNPTSSPTNNPTPSPTNNPSPAPTDNPNADPIHNPTQSPTNNPTASPTNNPTQLPTDNPSASPTKQLLDGTANPTSIKTDNPTISPTNNPFISPTGSLKVGVLSNIEPTEPSFQQSETTKPKTVDESNTESGGKSDVFNDPDFQQKLTILLILILIICCMSITIYIIKPRKGKTAVSNKDNEELPIAGDVAESTNATTNNNTSAINGIPTDALTLDKRMQLQIKSNSVVFPGAIQAAESHDDTSMPQMDEMEHVPHTQIDAIRTIRDVYDVANDRDAESANNDVNNMNDEISPTHDASIEKLYVVRRTSSVYESGTPRFPKDKTSAVHKQKTNMKMEGVDDDNNAAMPSEVTKGGHIETNRSNYYNTSNVLDRNDIAMTMEEIYHAPNKERFVDNKYGDMTNQNNMGKTGGIVVMPMDHKYVTPQKHIDTDIVIPMNDNYINTTYINNAGNNYNQYVNDQNKLEFNHNYGAPLNQMNPSLNNGSNYNPLLNDNYNEIDHNHYNTSNTMNNGYVNNGRFASSSIDNNYQDNQQKPSIDYNYHMNEHYDHTNSYMAKPNNMEPSKSNGNYHGGDM